MRKTLLAALAAAALASPAAAQLASPRVDYSSFTLSNGLRVLVSRDASVPVVATAFIVDVGGRHEQKGRSGFAHLFEHLMFEGSKNVAKGGFDRILESFGGDNNASTHADFTFYHEVLPSNALPVAFWLDADRIGALDVSQHAVKTQIEVVKEEKRMRIDNEPYGPILYDGMAAGTFSNWQSAHSIMGSFADLEAASLDDVRGFFKAYYSPDNLILAVVGDVEPEAVRALAEDYFGSIPSKPRPAAPDLTEAPPSGEKTLESVDQHAKLPALAVTWKDMPARGTPDYYALTLLGRALLSGKSSRLYQKLVKESQVAVGVDGGLGFPLSDWDEFKAPAAFGVFVTHKREAKAADVKALVAAEVARVAKEGLTPAELERVKVKFRSDWYRGQESRLDRARRLLYSALLDGDAEEANRRLEKFLAVGPEDVRRAAAALESDAATWFEVAAGGAQ
jgi:zinc protease